MSEQGLIRMELGRIRVHGSEIGRSIRNQRSYTWKAREYGDDLTCCHRHHHHHHRCYDVIGFARGMIDLEMIRDGINNWSSSS